jgi:DNA-binding GntR family transcriptional regulator
MRVCALMVDDMREMSIVLKALAVQAAAQISDSALNPEDLSAIEDVVTRMEKTVGDEDRGVWLESEKQFHMQLIRLCDNQRLIGIYENLFGLMERARYFTLYLRQAPVESTKEYREILSALSPGAMERLVKVYRAHWERSSEEILQLISKYTKGTVRATLGM